MRGSDARDDDDDDDGYTRDARDVGEGVTSADAGVVRNDDAEVGGELVVGAGAARAADAVVATPMVTVEEDEEAKRHRAMLLQSTKSFRATKTRTLEVYCTTWNVGNKAPTLEAATGWLREARESADIIAIGAQEASYKRSKKNIKPESISKHVGDKEEYRSTLRKKGFWGSSKWTKIGMMAGGMFAGGVLAAPVGAAPGMMCGLFAGYITGKKVVNELKVRTHWFDFLFAAMGSQFVLLQSEILLQMRLTVFIRAELQSRVRTVKVGSKATGIGNLVGNKGGLLVHIEFDNGETIAFVSCHLAAHEGPKFFQARNEMVPEILCRSWADSVTKTAGAPPLLSDVNSAFFDASNEIISKVKGTGKKATDAFQAATGQAITLGGGFAAQKNQPLDLLNSTTHTFFMGDLNYRLDPGMVLGNEWNTHWDKGAPEAKAEAKPEVDEVPLSKYPAARPVAKPGMMLEEEMEEELIVEASPFSVGRNAVIEHIQAKKFEALEKADQLKHAMRLGKVFTGFREMPLRFYPTFKRRGSKDHDKKSGLKCGPSNSNTGAKSESELAADPGTSAYYNEKRVPSWCDRVLVYSLPGAEDACQQVRYDARHDVKTSDHAPVFAIHRVTLRQLPAVNSLPRAELKFSQLRVTREFSSDEYVSSSAWVHIIVPHTRLVLPEASELSSKHVARSATDVASSSTANYEWSVNELPQIVVGFHETDNDAKAKQAKAAKSMFALTKSATDDDDEDLQPQTAADVKLGLEAYEKFQAVITLMDSRSGSKLGTAIIALSSKTFDVPLVLYSETVGRVSGAWSMIS